MEKKTIELLAPAGSWEALEAAVNAGADAVYMGGKAFGARAYASNFDEEEMAKAVYFAHMHHVRLYITVNTLVDDSELEALSAYLLFLNNVGVDGLIVQDLGVIRLAKKFVPELPLHASTQMSITNSSGVDFAMGAGMERSVLARELSLKEIGAACSRGSEIETFIHGALCVCYSGQCLMSSLIGGRSGNRGRCAQPCRLPYKLLNAKDEDMLQGKDAGQYLLSPKDMNTLSILPQLIDAGVVSYKIEGRMKRPEYVAVVVDAYRRAIDSYLAGDYNVPEEDLANIEQIFNRDFTTAYLERRPGRTMMSDRRPNNRGVLIGRVAKLDKNRNKAVIKLDKELHLGDGLEFWVSVGGRVGTTVTDMLCGGNSVQSAAHGQQVTIDVPNGVRLNDRVFRTLDSRLMSYAQQFFGPDAKKRIPVDAVVTARLGEPMTVTLTDDEGNVGYGETDFIVEAARKRALDEAGVRKQLDVFIVKTVLDYENTCLEQKYPDLRCLVQDYKEQALLKKIIDKEICKRAATDEAGLKAYFEKHRSDYQWEERRYRGIVLHGVSKRVVKQARKFLKSLPEEEWKDAIRLTFNAGAQPQIQVEQGVFAPGDNAYVDDLVFKGKDATPLVSFPFTAVLGKKVKGPDDYQEVKDRLVADYQTYLDGRWVDRLRSSAKVEINQEVLKTVNNH